MRADDEETMDHEDWVVIEQGADQAYPAAAGLANPDRDSHADMHAEAVSHEADDEDDDEEDDEDEEEEDDEEAAAAG